MTRIGVALLSFLIAAPTLATDAERDSLVKAFAATFAQHNLQAFDALAVSKAAGSEWSRIADLFERNRRVTFEVRGWRPDPGDAARIQVETVGRFLPRGPATKERDVPFTWSLEVVPIEGRLAIRSVDRAEAVVARRLGAAADDAAREAILERHRDLDLRWIARELGDLTKYWGLYAGRVDLADYAIALAERTGDQRTVALTMIPKIVALQLTVSPEHGVAYSAEVVEVARRTGDPDAIAAALFMRGIRGGGTAMLEEAATLIAKLEDPRVPLKGLTVAINFARSAADVEATSSYTDQLEELSRAYEWREGEMNALLARAQTHLEFGYTDLAVRENEELIGIATAEGNDRLLATASYNLALLSERRDPHRTMVLLERVMPKVDALLELWSRADTRIHLGRIYARLGCHDDAERVFAEALKIEPSIAGKLYRYLAQVRLNAGRYEGALAAARSSIEAITSKTATHEDLAFARLFAAGALRRLGRDDEAQTELEQAVALVDATVAAFPADALARRSFIEDHLGPYIDLINLLVDKGKVREALLLTERMRAGALRAELQDRHVDLHASMTAEEREQQKRLAARVEELNRKIGTARVGATNLPTLTSQLDHARAAVLAFRGDLYMRRPELRAERSLTREEVDLGPSDAAAIEFVVTARRTIVFAKDTRGAVSAVVIPITEAELTKRVERLTAAVRSRSLAYAREARELYDLLIRPVEPRLEPGRALCIVPDSVLWEVPFHVLQDRDGRHLVETRSIHYSSSLALSARSEPKSGAARLLAFGNPRLAPSTVTRARSVFREAIGALPEAETEVRAVASLYGKGHSRVYIGAAARESTFKSEAADYSVLHIAGHGVIDDNAPMFSALLLAAGDDAREDGMLEAREVLGLRLNADLAVLSACHTAGAQAGHGEGIIGLSWAFLAAGCPTTVVSQWKAESGATAKLMVAFHKSLVAGRTPSAALRDAQLTLLRDRRYAHPLYWATFVVMGANE